MNLADISQFFCPNADHRAARGKCWFSRKTGRHVRCLTAAEEKVVAEGTVDEIMGPGGEIRRNVAH